MDNDDRLVGRVLNRREVFKLLAIGGGAAAIGWRATTLAEEPQAGGAPALPPCVVRPELEEGPYFVDHQINRSDIRTDPTTGVASAGMPLTVAFAVSQISSRRLRAASRRGDRRLAVRRARCVFGRLRTRPAGEAAPPGFCAGSRRLTRDGRATFTTIFPGWYQGRAVHVHFKIRTTAAPAGAYEFTSQLFFDDTFIGSRFTRATDYAAHGQRDTRNRNDHVFQSGGTAG